MKPPLISCIVPTFNSERYLGEALDSIFKQKYRPLEVIVADGGSGDGTEKVVQSFGDKIEWIKQENLNPAQTRNLGLSVARGEWIAFLDADDLWHVDKLILQIACFQKQLNLDLCLTYVQMFWVETLEREKAQYKQCGRAEPIPGYSTLALLARRSAFDLVGAFDPGYWAADAVDWLMRASRHGLAMELIPEVLAYHRMHQNNLSRRKDQLSRDEFLSVVKASLDERRQREKMASAFI